jgi:phage-related baseplate assembly protein
MASLPEPIFFDTDEDVILSEMIADYELLTGKKLSPAQSERLLINGFAYREKMTRIAGNEAAKQCLLSFAVYPMLDYLGELVGVERLPASKAETTIEFHFVEGHTSLLLPVGIRLQSIDGNVVFTTLESVTVLSTENVKHVLAECTREGTAGNNYKIGDISIILDPQAFVSTVTNISVTNGGADQESDDALRERIRIAPASFSTAGPEDAYIYFAKSAHPSIIDVAITSPNPGDVNIYPLLAGGVQPSHEIIDAVMAKCNPKKIRPLNDLVSVAAPEKIEYRIEVNLTLLEDALQQTTVDQVNSNLKAYADRRKTKLGVDVKIAQIIAQCMIRDQSYDVEVVSPANDISVGLDQFASCTEIVVNLTGTSIE